MHIEKYVIIPTTTLNDLRPALAAALLGACHEGREWVATQPDAATAWATCPRGDWLVWLLGALHVRGYVSRQTLVLAACACAETVLRHVPAGEDLPRLAIEAARRWARGEATVEEVRAAANTAADAAVAYAAVAAADAAVAAADAAVAYAADAAAVAAADAAVAAADAAAVRNAVPWATVETALATVSADDATSKGASVPFVAFDDPAPPAPAADDDLLF
jgi:hypothetical protein